MSAKYRPCSEDWIQRGRPIKRAQELGFTLDEPTDWTLWANRVRVF